MAPDLAATSFAPGFDFVNNDTHPDDNHGHGTHIANIIAASATIVPIAPGATIMPIKVLDASDQGTELALAEGIRFAVDHGAHVIDMSLSFPPGYFRRGTCRRGRLRRGAGRRDGRRRRQPGRRLGRVPAAFRNVIAVGAVEKLSPYYRSPKWSPWLVDNLVPPRAPSTRTAATRSRSWRRPAR